MAPSLDQLESRQLLNTSPVHVHGEPLRHHRAAVVEHARHAHQASSRVSAAAATPDAATTGFSVAASPFVNDGELTATAAISATDIWAVGYADVQTALPAFDTALAEHFNGTSWSVVPTPTLSSSGETLPIAQFQGVAAVASNDVWAVGDGPNGALIEHWNGRAWSVVTSPKVPGELVAVAALSANNVVAVGTNGSGGSLVEHWNGTAWSVVPDTGPLQGRSELIAISADSPTDVWALEATENGTSPGPELLVHSTNGTTWSQVADVGGSSLTAISPTDVWIAGLIGVKFFPNPAEGTEQTDPRVEHWNGTNLSVVPTPAPPAPASNEFESSSFDGIAAVSAKDIVAVGTEVTLNRRGNPVGGVNTLIEQWDGTSWSIVSSPSPSARDNFLFALTAASDGTVVAVGTQLSNREGVLTPLILQN
jgi:hypothetical protein